MRNLARLLLVLAALAISSVEASAHNKKPQRLSPKISSAKSVYFDNQLVVRAVGEKALAPGRKGGRFRILKAQKQADWMLRLSASPPHGGHLILADGQTATIHENGDIEADSVPAYSKSAPVRAAYLTAVDPATGENLWSDSHVGGGPATSPVPNLMFLIGSMCDRVRHR
jgi:hypothetical protein